MDLMDIYHAVAPFWVVWLMILFGGIVYWAFRPSSKNLEKHGALPLRDDE